MIDRFGRTISISNNSDGSKNYSTAGISITLTAHQSDEDALNSLNGMAPESFILRSQNIQSDFLPYEFLSLFTDHEKTQIFEATNIIIRRTLAEVLSMPVITIGDEIIVDFLRYAASIGLLTDQRATFILSGRTS